MMITGDHAAIAAQNARRLGLGVGTSSRSGWGPGPLPTGYSHRASVGADAVDEPFAMPLAGSDDRGPLTWIPRGLVGAV